MRKQEKQESLKSKFDFVQRLATQSEIKELVGFLSSEKNIVLRLVRGSVLVQDFKKPKVLIYVYNHVKMHTDNSILSMTFRVLKTPNEMRLLENYDAIFNFEELKKEKVEKKEPKGRPAAPKMESIQKAILMRKYIEKYPDVNRDKTCIEFGIAKSTYYRAIKWMDAQLV
ncbi:hypothetical protein [Aquimarina pacifica]|uniref:hypothetical protein n=1 Tax=Aquimarina pacifica TaxID=1296415 RepID=UPI000472ED10|nr:hypothetical protein [Aquimarina pacifica]